MKRNKNQKMQSIKQQEVFVDKESPFPQRPMCTSKKQSQDVESVTILEEEVLESDRESTAVIEM